MYLGIHVFVRMYVCMYVKTIQENSYEFGREHEVGTWQSLDGRKKRGDDVIIF